MFQFSFHQGSKVQVPQIILFANVPFKIVDHFFQGHSFGNPSNIPDIFYHPREMTLQEAKEVRVLLKIMGKKCFKLL